MTGVATSIALFIGWAARGPTDNTVRISSFADYQRVYGGLDQRTLLGYSVQQFFNNGGADAYVIRLASDGTVAGTTAATPAIALAGGVTFTAASPGEWAHKYAVRVTPRTDRGGVERFKVEVLDNATPSAIEAYEDLSNDATDGQFVETVVNGRSSTVTAKAGSSAPTEIDTVTFSNGADGSVLDPYSTDTALQAAFHKAVLALFDVGAIADRIDLFNLVCVPGESDADTVQKLQKACADKRAFLIVDCTAGATVTGAAAELAAFNGGAPSCAAYYFPWVQAVDSLQQNAVRAFPPCGYVAGIYARTDSARGVWKAPAGTDATLAGATGLLVATTEAENAQLNRRAVNCLRTLPVHGPVVWGSRTMDGDDERASDWKYVPVRRTALFLEESLLRGSQWVVFEPNGEPLWARIQVSIGAFMQTLFQQGAFQGRTPRDAYYVRCDRETTTQADVNRGVVNIEVGFAPLKPAEFVVILIQQVAGRSRNQGLPQAVSAP